MKLLKAENSCGHFLIDKTNYKPIDKISKDDLLRLVDWTLHEDEIEFDDYSEDAIQNKAHQVIYRSIVQKLKDLRGRRQAFIDESARLYLKEYDAYRISEPKN